VSCIVPRAVAKKLWEENMRTSIAAALLCAPFAASAEKLLVEYQGTVSSVDRALDAVAPAQAIGELISGTLIIETTLAPPDEASDDPRIGRYGSSAVDFILGPRPPDAPGSGDLLVVYDGWVSPDGIGPSDGILIRDQAIGTDGAFNLVLGLQRPNLLSQLFASDDLVQSFDVVPEPGTSLWGYIERGFGELWSIVNFTLDRFSVTPGTCRL
jgi:hypothetical protein